MDFERLKSIKPREFLRQAWSKKDKDKNAPNIVYFAEQFNQMAGWVQAEVLKHDTKEKRAAIFKKFIDIAKHCRELHNYNSLHAIYSALNADALYRLKHTKELLSTSAVELMEKFAALFSTTDNFKALRQAHRSAPVPCVPQLSIFLKDLTFIEDGNPETVRGMINFDKFWKIAERVR